MMIARNLINPSFGTEIMYSFIIIMCSLIIYFSTREMYELSSYKGLKYFRLAFLFFAVAYFFRSFIQFVIMSLGIHIRSFHLLGGPILFIFMYASTMAIFYLLYSIKWKEWNGNKIYIFHIIALIISLISISTGTVIVLLLLQIVLFFFVASVGYMTNLKSKTKHGKNLYWIYILLFAFWILNIADILSPNIFQTSQLFIYIISISIFLSILYKVLRKSV